MCAEGDIAYRDTFQVDQNEGYFSEFTLSSTNPSSFTGEGKDFMPFRLVNGRILHNPDNGWFQVRCMKEYISSSGAVGPVWEYGGIMTPGGNIIAGMWWHQGLEGLGRYGVFLWWVIPEEAEELGRRDDRVSIRF